MDENEIYDEMGRRITSREKVFLGGYLVGFIVAFTLTSIVFLLWKS